MTTPSTIIFMPIAEGKSFAFDGPEAIRVDFLETIEYSGDPQWITYETSEFSAVCPFSGLPDYGILKMEYVPTTKIVELKSLKYYLISYRNVGVYQEEATHLLTNHIWECLAPKYLKLTTIYNTRGGIDTTCVMEKGAR